MPSPLDELRLSDDAKRRLRACPSRANTWRSRPPPMRPWGPDGLRSICWAGALLAERVGGWGTGRFDGGGDTCEGAGDGADGGSGEEDGGVDRRGPRSVDGDADNGDESDDGTDNAGDRTGDGRFECDLSGDVVTGCAECTAKSDLGSSFNDVEQGGVGDRDGTDEQGEASEGVEQGLDIVLDLVAERFRVGWYKGLEAVGLLRAQARGAWVPMS